MLPGNLSLADRFKLARDTGWEGIEAPPITDPAEAEKMRAGAEAAGLRIHSVIFGGWDAPLSHARPGRARSAAYGRRSRPARRKAMGADALLLVPAVVNAETGYKDAYDRSRAGVRRLVPLAEQLRVRS
jgi:hexulose-6-phosphate isomerase